MKELLIIIGVIIGLRIIIKAVKVIRREEKYKDWIDKNYITPEERPGYEEYYMTGMNFAGLKYKDLGYWEGHLEPQTSNPYDKYAIAVVRDDGKRIGWVSREQNKALRGIIGTERVKAYGYLAIATDDDKNKRFFYGTLMVKVS